MGLFNFGKKKPRKAEPESYSVPSDMRQALLDEAVASRFQEILKDSLRLIETTVYPKTFFGRYEDALSSAKKIVETTHVEGQRAYARKVISDLTAHRAEKIKAFVDRCNRQGKLYTIKDELLSGKYDIPSELKAYIEGLVL